MGGRRDRPRAIRGKIRSSARAPRADARVYERHGGKTIILARFVAHRADVRTFVAGVGAMSYPRFLT